MIDDLGLILASVGTAAGAAALLRRRAYRSLSARTVSLRPAIAVGSRHLAEALCADAEPLTIAGPEWRPLTEALDVSSDRLK